MRNHSIFPALTIAVCCLALSGTTCESQLKKEEVTMVSHVDIIPDAYKANAEESAAKLLRTQTAATQHDSGLIAYAVYQQNDSANHFTIVETWTDAKSYQLHEGADHTRTFRTEIQPFLGSPFDIRGHHLFH